MTGSASVEISNDRTRTEKHLPPPLLTSKLGQDGRIIVVFGRNRARGNIAQDATHNLAAAPGNHGTKQNHSLKSNLAFSLQIFSYPALHPFSCGRAAPVAALHVAAQCTGPRSESRSGRSAGRRTTDPSPIPQSSTGAGASPSCPPCSDRGSWWQEAAPLPCGSERGCVVLRRRHRHVGR